MENIENNETPDYVCQQMGMCKNQTCNLFPKRKTLFPKKEIKIEIPNMEYDLQAFEWPWELVANHLPAVDDDRDKFGSIVSLFFINYY